MEFKIKKQEYINKTFRITRELNDRLSEVAQREDISVNALVVQCCDYALANMKSSTTKKSNKTSG
jgi:predicted HicB family RNase H-like nuclease